MGFVTITLIVAILHAFVTNLPTLVINKKWQDTNHDARCPSVEATDTE